MRILGYPSFTIGVLGVLGGPVSLLMEQNVKHQHSKEGARSCRSSCDSCGSIKGRPRRVPPLLKSKFQILKAEIKSFPMTPGTSKSDKRFKSYFIGREIIPYSNDQKWNECSNRQHVRKVTLHVTHDALPPHGWKKS